METVPGANRCREKALDVLKPSPKQLERGLELHKAFTVVDAFGFAPTPMTADVVRQVNAAVAAGASQAEAGQLLSHLRSPARSAESREQYLEAWRASGVTAVLQNAGAEPGAGLSGLAVGFLETFYHLRPAVTQVRTSADILAAKKEGNHGVVFSYNSVPHGPMSSLEAAAAPLLTARKAGVRMMHLAYNRRNMIADGCMERADGGLSEFGLDIVRKMNEIGIIVDTAHTGRQSTFDAARASSRPVVASHTSARSVYAHPRAKGDEEMKAVAETGGLVGIFQVASFLEQDGDLNDWLNHVDQAVKVIGADHVAVASDTGYIVPFPEDPAPCDTLRDLANPWVRAMAAAEGGPDAPTARLPYSGAWRMEHGLDASDDERTGSLAWTNWPLFTVGLAMRGYSDADIEKLVGGNILRVLASYEE